MLRLRPLVFFVLAVPALALQDPVRVAQGSLSGAAGATPEVRVYKGIPYAAPPLGDLRWKAPKAAPAWDGVRAATKFSPICYQSPYPGTSIYRQEPQPLSEDCLYLNVWTAAKAASDHRPVMVWIHGGALTRGAASIPTYDGEALAKRGVIVVTINYRLGVFGFLAHPDLTRESDRKASGNYALLDQIAALEWVHKNIQAFGGDPQNVTIFGESAGSWSVNYLMATPLAKGLFQRAIGESGGAFAPMKTLADMEQTGLKFAAGLTATSVAALRKLPPEEILSSSTPYLFLPNVDGWLLPQDVYTIFSNGKQNDVPLLVGSNADEGRSLLPMFNGTQVSFAEVVRKRFGDQADAFLKVYPADTYENARAAYYTSYRDQSFGWQMRTWARMETKTGKSKAYLYYFTHVPPGPESSRYGAFHAAEIAYVFGNLTATPTRPYDDVDRKLSNLMSSYWVNFATSGDPNGPGLPKWPAYRESEDTALEFGDTVAVRSNINKTALDFFDASNQKQRKTN